MSKIIIYDFEIFKYDSLLGAMVLEKDGPVIYQTWDEREIRFFYQKHQNDVWIGWNSFGYDDLILEAIVEGKNAFKKSKEIITSRFKPKRKMKLYSFDLMNTGLGKPTSLKLTELISGNAIDTTEVDFNLDRPLTIEERRKTEKYNQSDLNQTYYNFKMFYDRFSLRVDLIKEFNLDLDQYLNATGTTLAARALGAKKNESLKYQLLKPRIYDTLQLKNQDLMNYYLNEDFRKNIKININIAGADITIGAGGAHSALSKYHTDKFLYFDVSGYYNLIMINYDLLSRAVPESGKALYEHMYHQQLALKKTNPRKRAVYKTILLSVFGAQINEYTDLADEQCGLLVTLTGELFICDLLEKLDGLVRVIQTNTDGIMVEPLDWANEQKILDIVCAWEARTGFTIKKEHKFNLWQRDVNNYICVDDKGELEYKGELFKNYDVSDAGYSSGQIFDCTNPPIVAKGVINYLMYGITPEQTVEENKTNLKFFQYVCKKNTYDYTTYELINPGTLEKTETKLQGIDRAFAYNSLTEIGMVYKHKDKNGKHSKAKVSNLPDNVFIYNSEINSEEAYNKVKDKIDYNFYVNRIYMRISECF